MYIIICKIDGAEYTMEAPDAETIAEFMEQYEEDYPDVKWVNSWYEYQKNPLTGLVFPFISL